MLQKVLSYYYNTVHPWEYAWTKFLNRKNAKNPLKKLNIGFCSVFPPFQNGAAAAAYYIIKELAKHQEIDLFLIPIKNKIDKRLFSFMPCHFTTVDDPSLDVIIFLCLGDDFQKNGEKVSRSCKTIAWQTMHNDPEKNQREQQTFDAIKRADLILAVTCWGYQCYKKQVPHVSYLPLGIDQTFFSLSDDQNKDDKKHGFTCLYISRIHYYKGIMPFLDCIPLVLEKDASITFRILAPIDRNSPHLDEVMTKISYLKKEYPQNVQINMNWIPYEKIPEQYHGASVLIFSSNNEGFGLPLIEAMSFGIPCIVLDKNPMSEIVIDRKTGFSLPPRKNDEHYHGFDFPDPKEIAKRILFLKKNEKNRKRMGEAARKRILEEYNLLLIINQLLIHCKELVKK